MSDSTRPEPPARMRLAVVFAETFHVLRRDGWRLAFMHGPIISNDRLEMRRLREGVAPGDVAQVFD